MRLLWRAVFLGYLAALGLAVAVVALAPAARALAASVRSNPIDLVALQPLSERSVVYDRHGDVLAVLHAEENRAPVPLQRVPEHVIRAVLAVEDERFFVHRGIDLQSTMRAFRANAAAGDIRQGGSTITQQLVKNALLTPRQDLGRKVKEAVLAMKIERRLSKRQILERYLNTVYFGAGSYGVQAAAERYFGKDAEELTIGDAAFLAGMIRNPVGYDPVRFPDRSRERRGVALDRLVALGELGRTEAVRLAARPLPRPRDALPKPDTYFVEVVKQSLLDDRRLGSTPQERYNAVFTGGLRIHTTFDPDAQRLAEAAVLSILPDTKGKFTAAVVSVEPRTGAVRTLVGGPGFEKAKYNLVTQGLRQPGSAWKPFTLVAAFEAGHSPRSVISGASPCSIPNPGGTPNPYLPSNYEGSAGYNSALTEQIVRSSNCAFARLAYSVGLDKVRDVAKRMGITTPIDKVPAMALGSEEVHPLDMASAFATLAADGLRREPYFVQRVETVDGRMVLRHRDRPKRAISKQHARMAVAALQEVVRRGTGTLARLADRPVAGKTGTAQEYRDAWFVGFTPQMSTAVWMGAPRGEISMFVGGIRVTGGSYPARIWAAFMGPALDDEPVVEFEEPDPSKIPRGRYIYVKGSTVYTRRRTSTTRRRASSTTFPPLVATTSPPTTEAPPEEQPPVSSPPDESG